MSQVVEQLCFKTSTIKTIKLKINVRYISLKVLQTFLQLPELYMQAQEHFVNIYEIIKHSGMIKMS